MRLRRKNCGGKRMTLFLRARESQVEAGAKVAAVCSRPPSWLGVGMMVSVVWSGDEEEMEEERGSM